MTNRKFFIIVCCVPAVILSVAIFSGIRVNLTDSMPVGLYQRVESHKILRGDLVAVCLPTAVAHEGLTRGYLKPGYCASGAIPILKRVVAVPNDIVQLERNEMTVWQLQQNMSELESEEVYVRTALLNRYLAHLKSDPAWLAQAAQHMFKRKLVYAPIRWIDSHWHHIKQFTKAGLNPMLHCYWLYGENNPESSWDSRYFGCVRRENIIGIYKPLLIMQEKKLGENNAGSHSPVKSKKNRHKIGKNNLESPKEAHLVTQIAPYFSQAKNFLTTHSQHKVMITWSATGGEMDNGVG